MKWSLALLALCAFAVLLIAGCATPRPSPTEAWTECLVDALLIYKSELEACARLGPGKPPRLQVCEGEAAKRYLADGMACEDK